MAIHKNSPKTLISPSFYPLFAICKIVNKLWTNYVALFTNFQPILDFSVNCQKYSRKTKLFIKITKNISFIRKKLTIDRFWRFFWIFFDPKHPLKCPQTASYSHLRAVHNLFTNIQNFWIFLSVLSKNPKFLTENWQKMPFFLDLSKIFLDILDFVHNLFTFHFGFFQNILDFFDPFWIFSTHFGQKSKTFWTNWQKYPKQIMNKLWTTFCDLSKIMNKLWTKL